jgi:hypothetical protein
MNKNDFLKTNEVQDFINWISNYTDHSNSILHAWKARSNKAAKKTGDVIEFNSINDAFTQYYWLTKNPISGEVISSFDENSECLQQLKEGLMRSINSNDANERLQSYDFCKKTLEWGGVWRRIHIAKNIKSMNKEILPYYLRQTHDFLLSAQDAIPSFSFKEGGVNYNLDIDSGTTKIYSLLNSNWIIYDGRVAAALGFLVQKWANSRKCSIPDILRFSRPTEPHRNPNPPGKNIFPLIRNDSSRLTHNLYANWLVQGILEKSNWIEIFRDTAKELQSRSLEAAFFMLGYCIQPVR